MERAVVLIDLPFSPCGEYFRPLGQKGGGLFPTFLSHEMFLAAKEGQELGRFKGQNLVKSVSYAGINVNMRDGTKFCYYYKMISQLEGTIAHKELGYVILDVNGVGYKIHVSLSEGVGEGRAKFWTHLHVREDALDLYGFVDKEALDIFLMLIKISGIGPKTALSMLTLAPVDSVREAIGRSDVGYLTKFAGIGKKTAEKIILELSDKMPKIESPGWQEESDALEALISLGYAKKEATEALRESSGDSSARVKFALRKLGNKHA